MPQTVWAVAAYEVDRCYGGPEEGGWWYDTGQLVVESVEFFTNEDAAWEHANVLREDEYKMTKARYSVLGGEDYNVHVYQLPRLVEEYDPYEDDHTKHLRFDVPISWPDVRPHYE